MKIGKKTVDIRSAGFLYEVKFKEGGKIPVALSGLYTNVPTAEQAVLNYNSTKQPEEE
jgi:hypothetical protein